MSYVDRLDIVLALAFLGSAVVYHIAEHVHRRSVAEVASREGEDE